LDVVGCGRVPVSAIGWWYVQAHGQVGELGGHKADEVWSGVVVGMLH